MGGIEEVVMVTGAEADGIVVVPVYMHFATLSIQQMQVDIWYFWWNFLDA